MDEKLNAGDDNLNINPSENSEKSYEEIQQEVQEQDAKDNPEEEFSEEELREMYIQSLKDSRKVFKPVQHHGKITTNQFGVEYKQKRKKRNTLAKKSRKANRK